MTGQFAIRLLLSIGLVFGLAGGFVVFVYMLLVLPRNYARQCGNSIPFKCTRCGAVHTYSCDESLKIKTKPRNQFLGRRTYRYPCAACREKTMQEPMRSAFTVEQQQILRKKVIWGMGIVVLIYSVGIVCGVLRDTLL
ncbi:MAG: hypothetical protein LBS98_07945 [Coriobacteriales bacterium]|nr:hypothetical protein [Coriobacteriales bacterium]